MTRANPVPRTYCTTREASVRLGVSLRTAQLWSEQGILEAWKTSGGHRRISRESVERLLQHNGNLDHGLVDPEVLNILVVEDEPSLRQLYQASIQRWAIPHKLICATNGYEALVLMGQAPPDLLITDLLIPGIDGFKMLQALKVLPSLAYLTVAVVTGLSPEEVDSHEDVPRGIPVFHKPIPFARLYELAQRCLAHKSHASKG